MTITDAEYNEANQYLEHIAEANQQYRIPASIICGILSRESRFGLALKPVGPSGTGDFTPRKGKLPPDGLGWGRGLGQIDYHYHEFARTGPWQDPRENILYAAKLLRDNIIYLRQHGVELHHAFVAAYNAGCGNVLHALSRGLDVDYYTTGKNYSRDVMQRAKWYAIKLQLETEGPYRPSPYAEGLKLVKPMPPEPLPITNPKSISSKLVDGEPTEPISIDSKDRPAAA